MLAGRQPAPPAAPPIGCAILPRSFHTKCDARPHQSPPIAPSDSLPLCPLAQPCAVSRHRAQTSPTWSHQIAPILYNNCTTCHHPGGAGPFSLLTYDDARRWSAQILTVTQSRFMPPWLPEPGYGDFADNRRLSAEDLANIKRWVSASMPEGIAAEAPAAAEVHIGVAARPA